MTAKNFFPSEVTANFSSLSATQLIASFAAQLAQQADEAVTRPLTKAQMDRAFLVLRAERSHLLDILEEAGMLRLATENDLRPTVIASFDGKSNPEN